METQKNDEKNIVLKLKHQLGRMMVQVDYMYRNDREMSRLDLDILMERTRDLYDLLCDYGAGTNQHLPAGEISDDAPKNTEINEGGELINRDVDFEIDDRVAPDPREKIFIKEISSCFGNKNLAEYLDEQKDKTLIIVGLQTNYCIDASVKSAFERGYRVIIPKGTNSTFDNDYMDGETTYKYYNEMMWPKRFAYCISLNEAIEIMEK